MITRIFRGKLVVIGDQGVGKTALLNMFVSDGREYPKNYSMTFAPEVSIKLVHIPNTNDAVELIIYDCPGIDLYYELLNKFWNGPDLLMVVFDLTNKNTLDSVANWINLAKKAKWRGNGGIPIAPVLLGNKIDLENRLVCQGEEPVLVADRYNMKYFFGSVKNNQGLEDPFQFIADSFYKYSLKNYSEDS
nr:intraflagellar transport protein 27 homolog isoform X1 [Halyomorpha halys]